MSYTTKTLAAAALAGLLGSGFASTAAYAGGEHMDTAPNNPSHAVSESTCRYGKHSCHGKNNCNGKNNCSGKEYGDKNSCKGKGYDRHHKRDRDSDGRDDRTGRRY